MQGRTVLSPYVGMVRKQDGGSNGCIIGNYTTITRLGASVTHFAFLSFSSATLANEIANRQPAKMRFCPSRLSSLFSQASALTPEYETSMTSQEIFWGTAPVISILAKRNVLRSVPCLYIYIYKFPIMNTQ